MPVPAHVLCTFSGTFGPAATPVEEWSIGLRFDGPAGAPVASFVSEAGAARSYWATHMAPRYMPSIALTRVRVAGIGPDGHVLKGPQGEYLQGDDLTRVPGTSTGTLTFPTTACLAVGLVTPRAGATGRGRVFLPWMATALDATHRVSSADATTNLTAFANLVRALDAPVGQAEDLVTGLGPLLVVSSKGYATPVTGFRVGLVPDSMSSRRRRLNEAYQHVAL